MDLLKFYSEYGKKLGCPKIWDKYTSLHDWNNRNFITGNNN